MKTAFYTAVLCAALGGAAQAGPIDRACARADRTAKSPHLCACIQRVANMTLTAADQRLAAQFIADPAKAQEMRRSDRPRERAFWGRYQAFGAAAEQVCSNR